MRPSSRFLLLLGLPTLLVANDGVDRYRKAVPNTFRLFPQPATAAAGYQILPHDMQGGADGDIRFRWAQPHAVALIQVAARAVARDLGEGPHPMAIMDLSAENGDTPVEGTVPKGRHPGGSHDGGLNMDLGYYLTSLKGKLYTPDFAAATDHFERKADGSWKDVPQCLGPADRLDVARQARFFLELFRIDRDAFGSDLLEEIGVDFQVRQPVIAQVHTWASTGRFGASLDLAEAMERVMTCDEAEGWARTHHHHCHVRVRDLPLMGRHRKALETLKTRARMEERELQGQTRLQAALLSTDLARSVEVEWPSPIQEIQFRLPGGAWTHAQPGDPRNRAVLDLPTSGTAGQIKVEAQGKDAHGTPFIQTVTLDLPEQSPRLAVAVETSRLTGEARLEGETLKVRPQFPAAYLAWITETALVLHRRNQAPVKQVIDGPGQEVRLDAKDLERVDLRVLCSGRRPLVLPLWVAKP